MLSATYLQKAPHSPGVYIMQDKTSVLYVGKAKDLHKRLSSYVRFSGSAHNKTGVMLSQVVKVDTIITHTEKEALILEASLIKKHKPKYNVILRDDKNYPLIKVTVKEEWPRLMMTRRRIKDGAAYFGPFSSSSAMWASLRLIHSIFPLRRCKGKKVKKRKRPCLNHQINNCSAPCVDKADNDTYRKMVDSVLMVLEGRNRDVINLLKKRMAQAADSLDFEQAAFLRDQIQALEKTLEKQVVVASHLKDQDVFGFLRKETAVAIVILFIREGVISGSRTYFLNDPYGDDPGILGQTINLFYDHQSLPTEIILPFEPEDKELLAERFSDILGKKVRLIVPKRGDKKTLVNMAQTNCRQLFEDLEKKEQSWKSLSQVMEKKLRLKKEPAIIECLDISNISGKQAVGSLVRFHKGEPDKSGFRHYRIRTIDTPDDYSMMAEVLERRFTRGVKEDNLPDLFVVDGGRGQLNMALTIAGQLDIAEKIDWIGIAKERQEEGEKLYKPGRKNPILLPGYNPVLLYLMRIRDESHRFGVTFHRKLRHKATLTSQLDEIDGIGPDRKKKLLKHMGSLKKIKNGTLEEIKQVPGIGPDMANKIYHHFHPVKRLK